MAAVAAALLESSTAAARIVETKGGWWPFRHTVQWDCYCTDKNGDSHLTSTSTNGMSNETCNQQCTFKGMTGFVKQTTVGDVDVAGLEAELDMRAEALAAGCLESDGLCTAEVSAVQAFDLFLAELEAGAGEPVCEAGPPTVPTATLGEPVAVDEGPVPADDYLEMCTLTWDEVYGRLEIAGDILTALSGDPFCH